MARGMALCICSLSWFFFLSLGSQHTGWGHSYSGWVFLFQLKLLSENRPPSLPEVHFQSDSKYRVSSDLPTTLLPSILLPPSDPRYLLSGVILLAYLVIFRVCPSQVHLRTRGEEADVSESSSSLASVTSLDLTHLISILPLALACRHPSQDYTTSLLPSSSALVLLCLLCISCTKICLHCKRTNYTGSFSGPVNPCFCEQRDEHISGPESLKEEHHMECGSAVLLCISTQGHLGDFSGHLGV